jgi:type II secretory ATPase GspE/PulE/Tfp pilus assembly ATPase PilB-like protein
MEVTDDLRHLIHNASPTHELRSLLRKQGVLTLREEGVRLALDGKTSLEEVLSVTHNEDISKEEMEGPPEKV